MAAADTHAAASPCNAWSKVAWFDVATIQGAASFVYPNDFPTGAAGNFRCLPKPGGYHG